MPRAGRARPARGSSSWSRSGCSRARASRRPRSSRSQPAPASASGLSSATSTPRQLSSGTTSTARSRSCAPPSRRVPGKTPLMTAIREVVVSVNRYRAEDVARAADPDAAHRHRSGTAGERRNCSTTRGSGRSSEFAASRLGEPADSLVPLAVGRTTLAACRAAYEVWLARADADLTVYLDAAIRALATGFRAKQHTTVS